MPSPRILKNFTLFQNGLGLQGLIDSLELPDIEVATEDFRMGGMDVELDADMGLKKLVAKFSMTDPDASTMALAGATGANRLVARGAFVRDSDQERVAVVAEMGGVVRKLSMGKWESGKKAGFDYEATLNYYRLTVGGTEICEIDVDNMIRRIGGVDQLIGIRQLIGLA